MFGAELSSFAGAILELNPNTLAGPIWWPNQGLNRILPAILGETQVFFNICLARPLEENPSCLSKILCS